MKFGRTVLLVGVSLALCRVAWAEPVRILVAAGSGQGTPGEETLKHPAKDASRVRDVFVEAGGVKAEHAFVVPDATPTSLGRAFDRAAAAVRGRRPEDVTFVFYFSGHGDREAIHLGGERMPLSDIASRVGQIPAALRITVTDACRTSRLRDKGVTTEPGFALAVDPAPAARGAVWIHASQDGEGAQESDDLEGAVFTHYWLAGLVGAADANQDRRVTLSESFAYAYNQTLYRSAKASGVLQRPTASFDLRENSPIVLTETTREATALKLPKGADVYYLIYALGSHTVTAEVWGAAERETLVGVPAGRYIVQRRVLPSQSEGKSGALGVSLGRGEQREVREGEFRTFSEEALAMKGGDLVVKPKEFAFGAGVSTGKITDVAERLELRFTYVWNSWGASIGPDASLGQRTTTDGNYDLWSVGASATLEKRFVFGSSMLRAGGGVHADYIFQRLLRADADRLALAGYSARETYRAFAPGVVAFVGPRFRVGESSHVGFVATGALDAARLGDNVQLLWNVGTHVEAGFSM